MNYITHFKFLDRYEIQWTNDLLEIGDTVEVKFNNQKESFVDIVLPFKQLYNFTPVVNDVNGTYQEGVHIQHIENNKIRVYAHVSNPYTGIMKIQWTAKGVF